MKRKQTIKIISVILLSVAMLTVFSVFASANTDELPTEEIKTEEDFNNIFDTIYSELEKNADKLLSALAFIGSLIIAFTYKRGLMPTLKSSVGALASSVNMIKEDNDRGISAIDEAAKNIFEKLERTEEDLIKLSLSLENVEKALRRSAADKKEAEDIKKILSSQVDMLYEIFMTSSLPQYRKDDVGERITEMRKTLLTEEKVNA